MAAKTKVAGKKPAKAKPPVKARPAAKAKPNRRPAAKAMPPAPKLPLVAVKPKKPTAPSLPLPPPPPPVAPPRDELPAPRDVARLLRYGEKLGARKIDIRMLTVQLPVASTAIAIADPAAPKTWRAFDRPVAPGVFRVMLSLARDDKGERLAAVVIHVGRPPIARWTVAHYKGQKPPKTADQLPRLAVTSGWLVLVDAGEGAPARDAMPAMPAAAAPNLPVELTLADGRRALAVPCGAGEYAAYWAVDAADKPIALVVDFDVFTQKEWKAKPT